MIDDLDDDIVIHLDDVPRKACDWGLAEMSVAACRT